MWVMNGPTYPNYLVGVQAPDWRFDLDPMKRDPCW